jgi:hypothetical protein
MRAQTGIFAGRSDRLPSFDQSTRPSYPSKAMFAWAYVVNLDGLETVLLSDTSKITELGIHKFYGSLPIMGLTRVLQALGQHPTLTKLGLRCCPLGREEPRLLHMALCNISSFQSLDLASNHLGSAKLVELAPALYDNTLIKELNMSDNHLDDIASAEILRDILRSNKTMTTLDLSGNKIRQTTGALQCIASGLRSNSTLLKIDLSSCRLRDDEIFILEQTLGSRKTTLGT